MANLRVWGIEERRGGERMELWVTSTDGQLELQAPEGVRPAPTSGHV